MKEVTALLDEHLKRLMGEAIQAWQQRRIENGLQDALGNKSLELEQSIVKPLGPGEWDESIGLPLCVVCHHVGCDQ